MRTEIPGCETKPDVCLVGVQAVMARAAMKIAKVYKDQFGVPCVITSGTEGEHSPGSLHYKGLALDFRTRTLAKVLHPKLMIAIIRALDDDDFDLVLEKTHLHVEYDPK